LNVNASGNFLVKNCLYSILIIFRLSISGILFKFALIERFKNGILNQKALLVPIIEEVKKITGFIFFLSFLIIDNYQYVHHQMLLIQNNQAMNLNYHINIRERLSGQ
jgi:hypothetical protein